MFAIAVARELKIPLKKLKRLNVALPTGRSRRLKHGELSVIDETYNSSPEAAHAALELLVSQPGRHFAVLGTMLELGDQSVELHRELAESAARLKLDGLVVVAESAEAEAMAFGARNLPRLAIVSSPQEAVEPLNSWLRSGDVVLLKASRGIGLDKLLPLLPAP